MGDALNIVEANISTIREPFLIDDHYLFEIGGKNNSLVIWFFILTFLLNGCLTSPFSKRRCKPTLK